MGSTPSPPPPPPPPPTLSEEVAFDIATRQYGETLVGVGPPELSADANAQQPYHWEQITLVFAAWTLVAVYIKGELRREAKRAGQSARASVLAWLALSSCAGYSGRENPRFWKRVFAHLMVADRRPIADEVRFFADADHPFPCVRLTSFSAGTSHTCRKLLLRAFFQPSAIDRKLHRELAVLEPHLAGRKWWRRAVPVEIFNEDVTNVIPRFLSGWRPDIRRQPTFRVVSVQARSTPSNKTLCSAASKLGGAVIHIPDFIIAEPVFRVGQRAPGMNTHVSIDRLRSSWPPEGKSLRAMCSALPYVDAVKTLRLVPSNAGEGQFSHAHMAWLGYALLHPDAANNTANRRVVLNLARLPDRTTEMLGLMAMGNNLLVATGGTTTVSTAYHLAQVTRRTGVRGDAGDCATPEVIHTLDGGQRVTLCVASLEELNGASSACVVIPDVGLGWVKTTRIQHIVSQPPGCSQLRVLELLGAAAHADASAPRVLSVLGASLTELCIEERLATDAIQVVLRNCPQLIHLSVAHDGDCWSHPRAVASLPHKPRLRSLKLFVAGPLHALDASQLGDLSSLHVVAEDRRETPFASHREAFIAILRRYPRLSRVDWSHLRCQNSPIRTCTSVRARPYSPRFWADDRDYTSPSYKSAAYRLLSEGAQCELGLAHESVSLDVWLAFLSVFYRKMEGATRLARLPPDVIRVVSSFVSKTVPRLLRIKDCKSTPLR